MTMSLIETKTLASAAASIEFTSIPQDGTDLLVTWSLRGDTGTAGNVAILLNINGVGTNRSARRLYGAGSGGVGSDSGTNNSTRGVLNTPDTTANTFTSGQAYFTNYTAAVNKSFSIESVLEMNTSGGEIDMVAALWSDTSAITSLTFLPSSGNFVTGSTLSLYKVTKGSDGIVTTS